MKYALIDTANTFFRARHVASRNSTLEEKIGMTLHLTLASVNQAVRRYGIDHVVFCLEGRSWRKDVYGPYKKNRVVDAMSVTEEEKEEYFTSLGINLNTLDTTSDPQVNLVGGQALEDSLAPNSNNPLVYKDFQFVLDNDKENKLSFPRRRIVATRITDGVQIVGDYSFSASTQILVDEVKFKVDKYLSEQLTIAAAPNEQLTIAAAPNERTAFTAELL